MMMMMKETKGKNQLLMDLEKVATCTYFLC